MVDGGVCSVREGGIGDRGVVEGERTGGRAVGERAVGE
jgi:hypothetical protein